MVSMWFSGTWLSLRAPPLIPFSILASIKQTLLCTTRRSYLLRVSHGYDFSYSRPFKLANSSPYRRAKGTLWVSYVEQS
jgi:hypothetical protein